ncbi:hypothetical protein BaRGS_00017514 [Batillaria attramentaria]|uniref:Uncharacterized protein n=1 Tax=Batillaria attramentaria TaxID=370345 RepID=A0ABD0KVD4_9CAEN
MGDNPISPFTILANRAGRGKIVSQPASFLYFNSGVFKQFHGSTSPSSVNLSKFQILLEESREFAGEKKINNEHTKQTSEKREMF